MRNGDKVDFGKIASILRYINDDALQLADIEFLPQDFFVQFSEGLELASFVDGGWATLTKEGETVLETVWKIMCITRELDPEIMYDNPLEFFKAQAEDAEVIPIERGKK